MAKKEIVILGIGRFAKELIRNLNKTNKFNIVAIDNNQEKLESLEGVKNIIKGDATNKEFLFNIGIENADFYIVGMGQDFQASLVITSLIKEKFKGEIFAKSIDENHERILESLGVSEVITPEVAAARIVFRRLINPLADLKDGGKMYQMAEIAKGVSLINVPVLIEDFNKPVKDAHIPEGIMIGVIKKKDQPARVVDGNTIMEESDILTLIGEEEALLKLLQQIKDKKLAEEEAEKSNETELKTKEA